MTRFILSRLLQAVPILLGLSVLVFLIQRVLPGDPAYAILGQGATPQQIDSLRDYLHLDRPLHEQYFLYLGNLMRGDFGVSAVNGRPVMDEFLRRFPATIELTAVAMAIAVVVGIPLGRLAARRPHSAGDGLITAGSIIGVSIPTFVLGLTLQYFLAVQLDVLPSSGRIDSRTDIDAVTNFMLVDTLIHGDLSAFMNAVAHIILPAVTLAAIPLAVVSRITRASILEVAKLDYVRTARAKGLGEGRVSNRHVMRNAWLPVVTVIGLQAGVLLAGAVITETVFAWNGVGRWVVEAIKNHDYAIVQSMVLIAGIVFVLVNLAVDVAYAVLDPRIRAT